MDGRSGSGKTTVAALLSREQSIAFWHEWMGEELPFLAREGPWERADVVVCGTPACRTPRTTSSWRTGR